MRLLIGLISFSILFTACRTQNKVIYNYLEDVRDSITNEVVLIKEPVIQKNDLLSIQVFSASIRPEVDALYNLSTGSSSTGTGTNAQLFGFLVDQNGNVEYPRIGTIRAEGLTKTELANEIKSRLQGQLTQPSVIIRFMNFRITVMGEVGNPGVLTIPTERLTLLEALGMAGDITEFGKKKEVRILRENNGKREIGVIDVTSEKMFQSPFYQLQQNDVVLIEQTHQKIRESEQQRRYQQVTFALSVITSIALLVSLFFR